MRPLSPRLRRGLVAALLPLVSLATVGTLVARADNPNEADLALTKTASASAGVGGSVTYTIRVVNNGSLDEDQSLPGTKTHIHDDAPAGISFTSTEITHISTHGDRCTTTAGTVDCDIRGNIRHGGVDYVEVQIVGVVTAAPTHGTTICNVASVTGNHPDSNLNNNHNSDTSACTTVTGTPPARTADLSVTKTASATEVSARGTVNYTVTAHNGGPDTANNVVVSDQLPEGVVFGSFIGTPAPPCTEVEGVIRCQLNTLASGQDFTVTYSVNLTTAAPGTSFCNRATVSSLDSGESDPHPENNVKSACVSVRPQADLSITKVADKTVALIGEDVTYTITVKNNGPNTATNVVVTDHIPAQATLGSAMPSTACGNADPVICTFPSLASGSSVVVTIKVTPKTKGPAVTNTATATADQADPTPSNSATSAPTAFVALVPSGAFGESVDVTALGHLHITSGPLASVTLPAGGGGPFTASAVNARVRSGLLGDLVRLDLLQASTQGGKASDGTISVVSSADVAKASLVNGLITVDGLHSDCLATTAGAGRSSANVVNLRVLGLAVQVAAGPNSTVMVPGVGTLILNEQIQSGTGLNQSRSVNALHLKLDGLLAKGDVILAHSDCGIDP